MSVSEAQIQRWKRDPNYEAFLRQVHTDCWVACKNGFSQDVADTMREFGAEFARSIEGMNKVEGQMTPEEFEDEMADFLHPGEGDPAYNTLCVMSVLLYTMTPEQIQQAYEQINKLYRS